LTNNSTIGFEFLFHIALFTKWPLGNFHKTRVGQLNITRVATKTLRMPIKVNRFYDASIYELFAFATYWREQKLEIVFAKFPILKLVVNAILKCLKTLGASKFEEFSLNIFQTKNLTFFSFDLHKTLRMICLTFGIDNFLFNIKWLSTA